MLVLGIETTCDETAAAVVRVDAAGKGEILSNVVRSQIAEHAPYGGVVPEIAARAHVDIVDLVIEQALRQADIGVNDLDAVAAAGGPGLVGGVLIGLTTAKAIALIAGKPLIAVNHLEAHALTARLTDQVAFPYLLFLASGGHTQLLAVTGVGSYTKLGTTIDDAIGEAFDKVAKLLDLPYPGGPEVEQRAKDGDAKRFAFPRPLAGRPDPDFSLSGLKTAVRQEAERVLAERVLAGREAGLSDKDVADLCASFQMAVADMVADRCRVAIKLFRIRFGEPSALVVAGGVGANQTLKRVLQATADATGLRLVVPPPKLCTDNGAMIAWAGAERLALGLTDPLDIAPRARWPLDAEAATVGSGRLGAKA
ncbi:tRNA (adenosine(37)-N6)-threonylcarbamoyltransferase complex transferase subunit TsaD [Phreatobacter stygius]|uniref:tRNA N6-adenosine threonylcarbamoyltransferase n=1 Tax=Phreatobacter stygius TaxID=1940610 RepID=A0A4D7B5D5_9HYPH|nr:tRNA (adenosine(37)-N6)-threonylcarbamoyltransferase complex transferase subunit TsaD [Phreatobacter stygius]QCI64916.1 tRNA (adenosine(37)-N6)-threonylcarbamoyltransferase complex transferase subunit TsaD [Phreatobacter stygius]